MRLSLCPSASLSVCLCPVVSWLLPLRLQFCVFSVRLPLSPLYPFRFLDAPLSLSLSASLSYIYIEREREGKVDDAGLSNRLCLCLSVCPSLSLSALCVCLLSQSVSVAMSVLPLTAVCVTSMVPVRSLGVWGVLW